MKTVDLAKASKSLSAYADELGEEPLILTVDDQPVAALVSLKNVDQDSLALSTSQTFLRLVQSAREELERGGSVSLEEMKGEPG
ncbi:MAG: type II toxin-antitoxin system Phd/YefM family antitoxin [Acidobacteriota bacterium]|nr:type II toxin-antitoxin system Phd/YefM family antitoxin [Acidobacteriota bacterium]